MSRTTSPRAGSSFPLRSHSRRMPVSISYHPRARRIRRNCARSGNGSLRRRRTNPEKTGNHFSGSCFQQRLDVPIIRRFPVGRTARPWQIAPQMPAGETLLLEPAARKKGGESLAMSQTSTSKPPQIKSRLGAILRSTSGNFLEQFDFFLFGFYAPYIARAFFPSENETAALLNTFGVFWLGALMRPVGAIVLGAYIDRIGRRKGLIVTLTIMAIGTVTIAVCPTYASIGVAAPVIVLIGRLLQGFSAGVELGGVSVYLAEIATPGNRGFYTSFQSASQQVAIFVAAIIGFVLSEMMPAATVAEWGWRIPFFIGCLIIPFIFFLRRTLEETPEFLAMKKHPSTSEVFSSAAVNWKIILLGMLMVAMTTVTFYFVT